MTKWILLATNQGLSVYSDTRPSPTLVRTGLSGRHVTSVIAHEGVIIAGTQDGIFRSSDLGENWESIRQGLLTPHIRWLAFHPHLAKHIFAGTEPAGIFRSTDGGDLWQYSGDVSRLRDDLGWWLPYSPEAGCVRGFAFHGDRGYAAVEVGGVLRSLNAGLTWSLAPGSDGKPEFKTPAPGYIHADVHSVAVHPGSPDLVFAATNAGLYRSSDGGARWEKINDDGYTRAFRVADDDPDHIITGPAKSVGRFGTILETTDGGATWSDLTHGLETPWPNTMVERFEQLAPDSLAAVLDDGSMFRLDLPSRTWHQVFEEVSGINAVTTLED